jgi:hypothetical protein
MGILSERRQHLAEGCVILAEQVRYPTTAAWLSPMFHHSAHWHDDMLLP